MIASLRHTIVCKLRSTRGETIAEVLVSMLIGALAILMLATAITVSSKISVDNRANMNEYYENSNEYAADSHSLSSNNLTIKSGSSTVELVGKGGSGS